MNKSRRDIILTIRISDEVMSKLLYIVRKEGCTKSKLIRSWIREKYAEKIRYVDLLPYEPMVNPDDLYDEDDCYWN